MSLLEIHDLSVSAGGRLLLESTTLDLRAGEITTILGPNGAGKSTLLRAVCGDINGQGGEIRLNGRPMDQWSPRQRARQMAVLAQHNSLEFAFTGREVVALGRTPHASGRIIDEQIGQAAMAALDVTHLAHQSYPRLSGGEQQRIQLARVLAQIWRAGDGDPRLLLLDEPVTSLDIGHQWQCLQVVRSFARQGVGVLMVLHDMTLAAAFSDRLLVMSQGRCVADGTPEQVLTNDLIQQVFATPVCIMPHPVSGKPVVINQ